MARERGLSITPEGLLGRSLRVTMTNVEIPRALSTRRIPINTVAGIGLCLPPGATRNESVSWWGWLWTTDGEGTPVPVHSWAERDATGGWATDPSGLEAGQQIKQLWHGITEVQGASGPLITVALQHHQVQSLMHPMLYVWCPDDGTTYEPPQR